VLAWLDTEVVLAAFVASPFSVSQCARWYGNLERHVTVSK